MPVDSAKIKKTIEAVSVLEQNGNANFVDNYDIKDALENSMHGILVMLEDNNVRDESAWNLCKRFFAVLNKTDFSDEEKYDIDMSEDDGNFREVFNTLRDYCYNKIKEDIGKKPNIIELLNDVSSLIGQVDEKTFAAPPQEMQSKTLKTAIEEFMSNENALIPSSGIITIANLINISGANSKECFEKFFQLLLTRLASDANTLALEVELLAFSVFEIINNYWISSDKDLDLVRKVTRQIVHLLVTNFKDAENSDGHDIARFLMNLHKDPQGNFIQVGYSTELDGSVHQIDLNNIADEDYKLLNRCIKEKKSQEISDAVKYLALDEARWSFVDDNLKTAAAQSARRKLVLSTKKKKLEETKSKPITTKASDNRDLEGLLAEIDNVKITDQPGKKKKKKKPTASQVQNTKLTNDEKVAEVVFEPNFSQPQDLLAKTTPSIPKRIWKLPEEDLIDYQEFSAKPRNIERVELVTTFYESSAQVPTREEEFAQRHKKLVEAFVKKSLQLENIAKDWAKFLQETEEKFVKISTENKSYQIAIDDLNGEILKLKNLKDDQDEKLRDLRSKLRECDRNASGTLRSQLQNFLDEKDRMARILEEQKAEIDKLDRAKTHLEKDVAMVRDWNSGLSIEYRRLQESYSLLREDYSQLSFYHENLIHDLQRHQYAVNQASMALSAVMPQQHFQAAQQTAPKASPQQSVVRTLQTDGNLHGK